MNPVFYSPSTHGFYLQSVNGDAMPADVVEITAERHQALLSAQSGGKTIEPGKDGAPEAVDAGASTPSQPPAKIYTRRRHIWERATDDECATLTGTLQQANDRLSQIFQSSDWIDHDSEWFSALQASIVGAVGQARADALLAPSPWPEV